MRPYRSGITVVEQKLPLPLLQTSTDISVRICRTDRRLAGVDKGKRIPHAGGPDTFHQQWSPLV
ncbi:MAG: hypothetical protein GXP26_11630 [Planctomycetes bacterium]|nr:hypothetical protein [Planctomycetota bacterium]